MLHDTDIWLRLAATSSALEHQLLKSVLGKPHSERCFGKGSTTKRKRRSQAQRAGTERADTGTASVCGEGTEKNQMAARFDVRLRRPFLEDLGRSRLKKGSSAWKKDGP